jgi:hypothetical protein
LGLFALLLAIFIIGVVQLLLLRFKSGDVYPPYSSLRSDPLGTRVFYESLRRLNTVAVQRHYQSLSNMPFDENTTIFYLGASISDWVFVSEDFINIFDRLAFAGSRLVLSFRPIVIGPSEKSRGKDSDSDDNGTNEAETPPCGNAENPECSPEAESIDSKTDKPANGEKEVKKRERMNFFPKTVSLKEHWGIQFSYREKVTSRLKAVSVTELDRMPALSWHTVSYFDEPPAAWRTLYAVDGRPVMLERKIGQGSIILSADSYFFSNEALRSERHPDLLTWLVGSNAKVIFDESHFGVYESPGISALIRTYRFHWFLFGMAIVAILFIWRNAAPLIPARPDIIVRNGNEFDTQRDFTQGLISLLRRNVSSRQILKVCLAEWKKSYDVSQRIDSESLKKIESMAGTGQSKSQKTPDPVNSYRLISRILAQRGKNNE